MGDVRTRNFGTIVYPESAPADWIKILEKEAIPALISPLHDKDVDDNGKLKKPHFHVMILFSGVKTKKQATEVFDLIGGVGLIIVKDSRGYARYMCHLDNKDKVLYDKSKVISLSGADYEEEIKLTRDKYKAVSEMIDFCIDNNVVSYSKLLLYAKDNHYDWFKALCEGASSTIVQFMKSRNWEKTVKMKDGYDYENTE